MKNEAFVFLNLLRLPHIQNSQPMIVKEIVCEILIAVHVILFIQSRREKYNIEK